MGSISASVLAHGVPALLIAIGGILIVGGLAHDAFNEILHALGLPTFGSGALEVVFGFVFAITGVVLYVVGRKADF